MKRIYVKPATEIVVVETEQLMDMSLNMYNSDAQDNAGAKEFGGGAGFSFDLWNDGEEE